MIVLLIILLVFLFGLLGFGFASYFIIRKKFFNSLNSFLMQVKSDISFNSKRVTEILLGNKTSNSNLSRMLCNYNESLINNISLSKESLFKGISFLSEQEMEGIFNFFSSLGRVDVFNQVEQIELFIKTNAEYCEEASRQCTKNCALYTKLGILFGLLVAILII